MGAMDRISLGVDSSGRSVIVNRRTLNMLREAERRLGFPLTIVQGSYKAGAGAVASAGTHDGGGVIDLRSRGLTDRRKVVEVLRKVGFAAWLRVPPSFDEHIHAVALGDRDASQSAKVQMLDYRAGRNGLANKGPDDGPKVTIRRWELVKRMVAVRFATRDLKRAEAELAKWRADH